MRAFSFFCVFSICFYCSCCFYYPLILGLGTTNCWFLMCDPREVENRVWGEPGSRLSSSFSSSIRGFWPYLFCTSTLLTNQLLGYSVRKHQMRGNGNLSDSGAQEDGPKLCASERNCFKDRIHLGDPDCNFVLQFKNS